MNIQNQATAAMQHLHASFAPFQCITTPASRKGGFSFTVVDERGVACRSERLYPEQYNAADGLERVIARTRRALVA